MKTMEMNEAGETGCERQLLLGSLHCAASHLCAYCSPGVRGTGSASLTCGITLGKLLSTSFAPIFPTVKKKEEKKKKKKACMLLVLFVKGTVSLS